MRIYIDPGHGGEDPGATFHELIEKDITLEVSLALLFHLRKSGHIVEMSRGADFPVSLFNRWNGANEFLGDIFLSIHLNADPDPDEPGMPEGKGHEFWIYPKSKLGRELAACINWRMCEKFPSEKARGIKEARFAVLRSTKMPAVLLELAFIDNSESDRLKDPAVQERLVDAISKGIDDYSTTKEAGNV